MGEFGAPQWKRARPANNLVSVQLPAQYPVAYARNTKVQLTARFKVTKPPTCPTDVWVKGTAQITQKSTMVWVKLLTVKPSDHFVEFVDVISDISLPDHITYYDPFWIEWIFNTGTSTATRQSAGASTNPLYVLHGAPIVTPIFWTLVHHSCRAAHGHYQIDGAVKSMYTIFEGAQATPPRPVKRVRDGIVLTYWKPPLDIPTTSQTDVLLSSRIGNARCGNWSSFMVDMCRTHGIANIEGSHLYVSNPTGGAIGMLVKNWSFIASPKTAPFSALLGRTSVWMTHRVDGDGFFEIGLPTGECINQTGVAAQGNSEPQPFFVDHAIVKYFVTDSAKVKKVIFYDPSYGTPATYSELEWEMMSLDGVTTKWPPHLTAGRHPGVKVFDFHKF